MITSKNINIILLVVLFISLTIYHLLGIVQGELGLDTTRSNFSDYYTLISIGKIFITLAVIMLTLKSKLVAKIVFRENYIGGKYIGESKNEHVTTVLHTEIFEVEQNLLETTISGISKNEDKFHASYKGKLNEIESKHFKFLISVSTSSRTNDGVFDLRFDKGEVYGFYNSTTLGSENHRRIVKAKRIKKGEFPQL